MTEETKIAINAITPAIVIKKGIKDNIPTIVIKLPRNYLKKSQQILQMSYQPGPAEYLKYGFKAIRTRGSNPQYNPKKDYKQAKQSIDKGYTKPSFQGMSLEEIDQWEKSGGWTGWLMPNRKIVIDAENGVVLALIKHYLGALGLNPCIQRTNNGEHFLFEHMGPDIPGSSGHLCAGGFPVTPRVAGSNYVILPPTNGRDWEKWTPFDELPELPEILYPCDKNNKDHVARCIAWEVGESYAGGKLSGWEDIDGAFMGYLVESGIKVDVIHQCFRLVFRNEYDSKRTDEILARYNELKKNGRSTIGAGSFIKKINDLDLGNIKSFIKNPVMTNGNPGNNGDGGEAHKETRKSVTAELIEIANQYHLFYDEMRVAYAWVNHVALSVMGTEFNQLIARELYVSKGKTAGSDAFKQALGVIEGEALYNGKLIKLSNRVAIHEGAFYYDLGNGRAAKISPQEWIIDPAPPILFKRYAHQQAQGDPVGSGNLNRLFEYVNVTDDQQQLLFLVWVVSLLVPDIPHPPLYAHGPQGSAKTSTLRTVKNIIDPSKMEITSVPHDKTAIIQMLDHHYFIVFDNLSDIPGWFSDILSMAVTGGGLSRRKLYTDDDDVIFSYKRCIGLTGINMHIAKPDLLDRSILLYLDRLSSDQRKEETAISRQFEIDEPLLLGTMFDALSKAMKIYPTIKLANLPRMADFCRWGCAIAVAMGHSMEEFLEAYDVNIQRQHQEVLNENTLARSIVNFMKEKSEWAGLVGELYDELKKMVENPSNDHTFPSYSNRLRGQIGVLKATLYELGISVDIADAHGEQGTPVIIKKILPREVVPSQTGASEEISPSPAEDSTVHLQLDLHKITDCNCNKNSFPEDPEDKSLLKEGESRECPTCKGHDYWTSTSNTVICATCHPPASEALVMDRER